MLRKVPQIFFFRLIRNAADGAGEEGSQTDGDDDLHEGGGDAVSDLSLSEDSFDPDSPNATDEPR